MLFSVISLIILKLYLKLSSLFYRNLTKIQKSKFEIPEIKSIWTKFRIPNPNENTKTLDLINTPMASKFQNQSTDSDGDEEQEQEH